MLNVNFTISCLTWKYSSKFQYKTWLLGAEKINPQEQKESSTRVGNDVLWNSQRFDHNKQHEKNCGLSRRKWCCHKFLKLHLDACKEVFTSRGHCPILTTGVSCPYFACNLKRISHHKHHYNSNSDCKIENTGKRVQTGLRKVFCFVFGMQTVFNFIYTRKNYSSFDSLISKLPYLFDSCACFSEPFLFLTTIFKIWLEHQ